MAQNHFFKDPDAILDFQIDWVDWLAGDTIATSGWTVPTGITKTSDTNSATTTTIWLSSGSAGNIYELVNQITTVGGRTEDRSIFVEVADNRVYTVGGRNIEIHVRQEVADDEQPYEYSSRVINNAIDQAVLWYNQMKPYVRENNLTTVVDQQLYELPSDAMRVTELFYKQSDTDTVYERLSDYYPFRFTDIGNESLTLVQQQLLRAFEEHARYFWEQISELTSYKTGRYVILYPPPGASGETIYFRYTRKHERTASDYPTIPWEDSDNFISLVVIALDKRELARMKRSPARYRDGQTEVDRRASLDIMRKDIESRWQAVQDAMSTTVIMQG